MTPDIAIWLPRAKPLNKSPRFNWRLIAALIVNCVAWAVIWKVMT